MERKGENFRKWSGEHVVTKIRKKEDTKGIRVKG